MLASKQDLKASEADFQKLLVTPEMLATKYGARAAIRRKLMEPVDALVDKAIEHIEAQLDEKLANETDDEKIEQLQLKADAIMEKIVRELDNPSIGCTVRRCAVIALGAGTAPSMRQAKKRWRTPFAPLLLG